MQCYLTTFDFFKAHKLKLFIFETSKFVNTHTLKMSIHFPYQMISWWDKMVRDVRTISNILKTIMSLKFYLCCVKMHPIQILNVMDSTKTHGTTNEPNVCLEILSAYMLYREGSVVPWRHTRLPPLRSTSQHELMSESWYLGATVAEW